MSCDTRLLDPAVTGLLGPVDHETSCAITAICHDALRAVLGAGLAAAAIGDSRLLARTAPWARDLARGLQFQARTGPGDPPTAQLLTRLASQPLSPAQLDRFAETVDLTAALTLDRLTEQVLGPGASGRNPAVNETAAPWLAGLKLGYRIGLVLELLRLASPQ